MGLLSARRRQAGQKLRCPRCFSMIEVPTVEELTARRGSGETYELRQSDSGPEQWEETRRALAAATCPRCSGRVYGRREQAGHEVACPDCGTLVRLAPLEEHQQPPAVRRVTDEYGVVEQEDWRPAAQRLARPLVRFACPLCATPLVAETREVGHSIECPDCGSQVAVPPPSLFPDSPRREPHPAVEEYALQDRGAETQSAPAEQAREVLPLDAPVGKPERFPCWCRVCGELMWVSADQVGTQVSCAECGASTTVHRPPPAAGPPPKAKTYEVEPAAPQSEGADQQPSPPPQAGGDQAEGPSVPEELVAAHSEPLAEPYRWRHLLAFPFTDGVWQRLVWLCIGWGATLTIMGPALKIIVAPPESSGVSLSWIPAMVCFAAGGPIAGVLAVVSSAFFLAVIDNTAEGADRVEYWPGTVFLDWIGDTLYVAAATAMAFAPGTIVGRIVQANWIPLLHAVSFLLLFPYFLISSMEGNSPWHVFSQHILRSFSAVPGAWARFYAQSGMLVGCLAIVVWVAVGRIGLGMLPVLAPLGVYALFVYARMIGLLARRCATALGEQQGEPVPQEGTGERQADAGPQETTGPSNADGWNDPVPNDFD